MTGKRCTDCKHTKGIGYDFWCGEGHTEYEVFGAETNCPYYEYHDWNKGVPSRTAKRFTLFDDGETIIDNGSVTDDGGKKIYWTVEYVQLVQLVDLLNELDEKWIDEFNLRETLQQDLQRVEEENKNLKTRFKEERELAMRLSRECDTLTIKKQELELEIIRLETIIKTGDNDDYNRTS